MFPAELIERIMSKTVCKEEHLIWTDAPNYSGTGPGQLTFHYQRYTPHRVLYQQKCPDAKFKDLERLCNENLCVNPDHYIHDDPEAPKDDNGFTEFDRIVLQHRLGTMTTPSTILTDDCIEHPQLTTVGIYSQIGYKQKTYLAHRLSLALKENGKLSRKEQCCHNCGNATCVNPKHLRWGDAFENAADKEKHGTAPRGERNPNAHLTAADAKEIYAQKGKVAVQEVAKKFNVKSGTIYQIWNGYSWSSATGAPKKVCKKRKRDISDTLDEQWRKKARTHFDRITTLVKDDKGEEHRTHTLTASTTRYKRVKCQGRPINLHVLAAVLKFNLNQFPSQSGLHVRHKCRFVGCCHFDHIELGTVLDNSNDRIRDGVSRNHAKISADLAKQIKDSKGNGLTQKERALQFGVTLGVVSGIDSGTSWKHV